MERDFIKDAYLKLNTYLVRLVELASCCSCNLGDLLNEFLELRSYDMEFGEHIAK